MDNYLNSVDNYPNFVDNFVDNSKKMLITFLQKNGSPNAGARVKYCLKTLIIILTRRYTAACCLADFVRKGENYGLLLS